MALSALLKANSIGPIRLSPGVTAAQVLIFLFVAVAANSVFGFINLMQPFVLTEQLNLAPNEMGRVGGYLSAIQQVAVICLVGFAGGLADRVGRRWMLIATLVGFSLCAVSFPLVSALLALFVLRAFLGVSSSAHTSSVPTLLFDLPANDSRGKFVALVMVVFAIGTAVLVGGVGARLPSWFREAGFSTLSAGRMAFYLAGAVGLVGALVAFLFMRKDAPQKAAGPRLTLMQEVRGFLKGYGEVARYAKGNPTFGMMFVTSFVIRTDDAILRSFLSLWIVAAAQDQGVSTIDALKVVGVLLFIQSAIGLIVPPIMGWLLDRVSRVTIYVAAMGMVGASLTATILINDVLSWPIYVLAAAIGIAESSQTISFQALFGQEAPEKLRGTAYGVFAVLGTMSVIAVTLLGGYLFDAMGYNAPFILAGGLHLFFFVIAILILAFNARRLAARQPG